MRDEMQCGDALCWRGMPKIKVVGWRVGHLSDLVRKHSFRRVSLQDLHPR